MLMRAIVTGIPPRVRKRVDQPPPRKYSTIELCQVVASRQAAASSGVISQKGFITGWPASLIWPAPSSVAGPELIKCRIPSAARPVNW